MRAPAGARSGLMVNASLMILLSPAGRVSAKRRMVLPLHVVVLPVFMLDICPVDIRGFGAYARLPPGAALLPAAVLKSCRP